MKRFVVTAGFALAAMGFANSASSQDLCSSVLKDGTFQTQQYRDNSYFQQIIWSRFLKSTFQTAKTDREGGFGIPIGEIVLGGNFSESDYNAKKESIRQEYFNQVTSSREIDVALSSGDEVIVGAWLECMRDSAGGLTVRFDPATSQEVFIIVQYFPQGTRHQVRLPQNVAIPAGVEVLDGQNCFRRGTRFRAGNACRARVRIDRAERPVLFTVNADEASAQAFLPARVTLSRQSKPFDPARLPNLNTTAFRAAYRPANTVVLTAEEIADGWRFDPATVQANLRMTYQAYWANRCEQGYATATPESLTYGFLIYGQSRNRGRNSSVICHIDVSALVRRDVWMPMTDPVEMGSDREADSFLNPVLSVPPPGLGLSAGGNEPIDLKQRSLW